MRGVTVRLAAVVAVSAGIALQGGAQQATDARSLEKDLQAAKRELSGMVESYLRDGPDAVKARMAYEDARKKHQETLKQQVAASKDAAALQAKADELAKQRKDADDAARKARAELDKDPAIAALKKQVEDANKALKAKMDELVAANQPLKDAAAKLAELDKTAKEADAGIKKILADAFVASSADVKAVQAKIADLEAKVAEAKKAAAAEKPKKEAKPKKADAAPAAAQ